MNLAAVIRGLQPNESGPEAGPSPPPEQEDAATPSWGFGVFEGFPNGLPCASLPGLLDMPQKLALDPTLPTAADVRNVASVLADDVFPVTPWQSPKPAWYELDTLNSQAPYEGFSGALSGGTRELVRWTARICGGGTASRFTRALKAAAPGTVYPNGMTAAQSPANSDNWGWGATAFDSFLERLFDRLNINWQAQSGGPPTAVTGWWERSFQAQGGIWTNQQHPRLVTRLAMRREWGPWDSLRRKMASAATFQPLVDVFGWLGSIQQVAALGANPFPPVTIPAADKLDGSSFPLDWRRAARSSLLNRGDLGTLSTAITVAQQAQNPNAQVVTWALTPVLDLPSNVSAQLTAISGQMQLQQIQTAARILAAADLVAALLGLNKPLKVLVGAELAIVMAWALYKPLIDGVQSAGTHLGTAGAVTNPPTHVATAFSELLLGIDDIVSGIDGIHSNGVATKTGQDVLEEMAGVSGSELVNISRAIDPVRPWQWPEREPEPRVLLGERVREYGRKFADFTPVESDLSKVAPWQRDAAGLYNQWERALSPLIQIAGVLDTTADLIAGLVRVDDCVMASVPTFMQSQTPLIQNALQNLGPGAGLITLDTPKLLGYIVRHVLSEIACHFLNTNCCRTIMCWLDPALEPVVQAALGPVVQVPTPAGMASRYRALFQQSAPATIPVRGCLTPGYSQSGGAVGVLWTPLVNGGPQHYLNIMAGLPAQTAVFTAQQLAVALTTIQTYLTRMDTQRGCLSHLLNITEPAWEFDWLVEQGPEAPDDLGGLDKGPDESGPSAGP